MNLQEAGEVGVMIYVQLIQLAEIVMVKNKAGPRCMSQNDVRRSARFRSNPKLV